MAAVKRSLNFCTFTSVKLDSKTRHKGWIDEYPSLIAIAWHGPVYEVALRYLVAISCIR